MRTIFRLLAAVLCLLPATLAVAQFENGSIVGTVHDGSGAVVSGATVRVTNTATGVVSTRTTTDSGTYEVPDLRVGEYNIVISHVGFSDAKATNISVSVGGRQRIDLSLPVGEAVSTVEVNGIALQAETDTSQRDQTITQYQSEALPLVSRNYSDLLGLVTGVRQAPTAATTSSINSLVRAGAYNVNGQRSMFNNFLLDGMDNNAYGESNQGFDNQIIAVPPDSVAQFSVVTNNESAEYGRSSGATINVASQGGTNRYHGTVYEFIRNTDLNAAGFFKPTTAGTSGPVPFKKPTFNRNQFGMNFGGPIIKDHLFFFLDYEGFRQTLKPLSVLTVPTQNELNGILAVDVQNPITGKHYKAGTAIPAGDINPISQQIVNVFKTIPGLPVNGVATTGINTADYAVQVPFTDNADKGDLRLDYQQNPNTSWFLRVSDRKENGVNFTPLPIPLDGQSNGRIRVLDQQIALGYTRLLGSNKIFDARLGLSRTKAGKYSLSIGNNSITVPGLPSNPVVSGGLPSTSINGGFTSFGRQSTNPQWQNPALLDPKVNFTWVKGMHSLKFGYEYEHVWMAVNDNNPLYGSFSYAAGYSLCPSTTVAGVKTPVDPTNCASIASTVADNYFADFLFGNPNNYSLANYFVAHLRQTLDSVYAQDDWRVNPRLTLNLGLRWEYGSPYSEQNNFVSNFDPISQTVLTITPGATGTGITPTTGSGAYGSTLVDPDLTDFGPRIGFAFAMDPKTAIRGGFGMSYVHYTRAGSGDILAINAPQAQFAGVTQIAPTATNHCNPLPANIIAVNGTTPSCFATVDQGFPSALVTTFNPATDNITYIPRNTKDSYVESYYLSLQRQLAKNTLIDVAYVGNHGVKLQGFLNANQKNPSLGFARPYTKWPSDITAAVNEFYSHYDALQVRYEQRSVAGLTLLNSFTWEHSLDNASASLEGNTPAPQDGNNISADYSQSDYNLPLINVTSLVYELPFGHGRKFMSGANGVVDSFLGGWQVSLINTMQAGTPFNITYSPSSTNAVSPLIGANYRGANAYRPNRAAGVPLLQNKQLASGFIQYVNPAAFLLPPTTGTGGAVLSPFGNATRNPGRSTPFYQTDLALNKRFSTPVESLKVEFRTEFYNILNHTNLFLPSTVGGTLGQPASTGGLVTSTFEPRIIQFGVKILY
ncbi:MAG TPA: TonB-dependent receptor [Acidobacteriaceae bacterium]|jgi:hypothetical protein